MLIDFQKEAVLRVGSLFIISLNRVEKGLPQRLIGQPLYKTATEFSLSQFQLFKGP